MNKLIYFLTIPSLCLTGCCTVTHKPYQEVSIVSNPSEANITVDGYHYGVTPQTLLMSPKHPHHIVLEKEGFDTRHYNLQPKVSVGNLSSSLVFPVTGLVAGAGLGLIAAGSTASGLGVIVVIAGAAVGLAAGTGIGVVGTGVDLYKGSAKRLPSVIKADLHPTHIH